LQRELLLRKLRINRVYLYKNYRKGVTQFLTYTIAISRTNGKVSIKDRQNCLAQLRQTEQSATKTLRAKQARRGRCGL